MNRALRAATMGVLLLSPLALSACSSGQVTQTATQERDKTGAQAQVGEITLRQVQLDYPSGGTYDEGDDADLIVTIVNAGGEPDTLTSVEGEGFADAEISDDEIELAPDTTVFVGEDDSSISLTDLSESLTTGQTMDLTFTFEEAGEISVPVTVGTPTRSVERGEAFDFHEGEENAGEVARENEDADAE